MGLAFFIACQSLRAQGVYIYCGQLIDCTSETVKGPSTIVVDGNKIKSVEEGYKKPTGEATVIPAKTLVTEEQLGTIEVGKLADIIATDGHPIDDISAVRKVSFVMKNGKGYKQ